MATLNGVSVSSTTINGTTGYDTINGDADSEMIYGLDGGDTINGFEGNDYLSGGNGSDLMNGGSGNDTLAGGLTGYDTMSGGEGSDIFVIERQTAYSQQTITDFTVGQDKLDLSATGISDIETLRFLSYDVSNALAYRIYTEGDVQIITLENQWVDSLTTADVVLSSANNAGALYSATYRSDLFAGAGNDTLMGSAYEDRLFGEAGNDSLDGGSGYDLLVGGTGSDILLGNANNDTLIGGSGNDTLDGGANHDVLEGGDGSDVFVLQQTGYAEDTIVDFDTEAGDKLDVTTLGVGDLDTLNILAAGSDTIGIYKDSDLLKTTLSGVAVSSLGASNVLLNTVSTNDVLSATYRSDLFGAGGHDTLTGSSQNDRLFGEVGNDRLNGGDGYDTLFGGVGDDTLDGGLASDTVLGGAGNDRFVINNDASRDLMIGGAGVDTVDYSVISNSVKVDLGISAEQKVVAVTYRSDTIREIENVVGGTVSDRLAGNSGANVLDGNTGDDILSGFTGNDTLIGGLGNDSLNGGDGFDYASYESASAGVNIDLRSNILTHAGTVAAVGTDVLINIEGLIGSKSYIDTLVGNSATNALNGSNDSLADILLGLGGNDTYYVGNGDKVYETITTTSGINAGGVDTVICNYTSGTYTLGNFVENLTLSGTGAINGTGNTLANKLLGNAAANILNGGLGNDILIGGSGIDYADYLGTSAAVTVNLATGLAAGGAGNDTLSQIENLRGGSGADVLTGDNLANTLKGESGNDTLAGGDGNDVLIGGLGKDALTGGNGNDLFDFNSLAEMGTTGTTWDVITDFAAGDRIDLSALDANTGTTANDTFSTIITVGGAFTGAFGSGAGTLYFDSTNHMLYGNADADTGAEFAIQLTGVATLSTAAFIL